MDETDGCSPRSRVDEASAAASACNAVSMQLQLLIAAQAVTMRQLQQGCQTLAMRWMRGGAPWVDARGCSRWPAAMAMHYVIETGLGLLQGCGDVTDVISVSAIGNV